MLWIVILLLVLFWAGGVGFGYGGSLIHLILLLAVIALLYQILTGRRVE